jgi:hypothetical protein
LDYARDAIHTGGSMSVSLAMSGGERVISPKPTHFANDYHGTHNDSKNA